MVPAGRQSLLDKTLERVAESIGDLTAPVIDRFYARHPDGVATFERLWPGSRRRLEAQMVSQTLYCLMYWLNSPGEIEVMLMGSVPHHAHTLSVPHEWYSDLLDSLFDVVLETIPDDEPDERENCTCIRLELMEAINASVF